MEDLENQTQIFIAKGWKPPKVNYVNNGPELNKTF